MLACMLCPFGEIAAGGGGILLGGLMVWAYIRHKAKAAILSLVRGRKRTVKIEPCGCDCCDHDRPK